MYITIHWMSVFCQWRYNCSVSTLSHWDSHDPLLDFCTITKAFLCWTCLGVTYLSTACVLLSSCLVLNALQQKHSAPVKQYTCTHRYTSLILFHPRCPIYIPVSAQLLRRENKLLERLQPRIIYVFRVYVAIIKTQDHCREMLSRKQIAHINTVVCSPWRQVDQGAASGGLFHLTESCRIPFILNKG